MNRPERSPSFPPVRDASAAPRGASCGAVFALAAIALVVLYFPGLRGELLWDDAGHVTRPELQTWSGLLRIWFEPGATQQYYPLLHSAFWVEHGLWGDATLGYHLINVLWHATSVCLFVAVLRRLALPGALLAGFLFAVHPVGVESVAWISEQKNTLSTVFYLAAALAWLKFEEERRTNSYVVATLWFMAALLTKTVTCTLPAALLVIAWWRRGRLSWRDDVRPMAPWLGLGLGSGVLTAWFERVGIGAQGTEFSLNFLERCLLAGRVFWFYLGKLVWPADLMFFYPRWQMDPAAAWQYLFPLAAAVLFVGIGWRARRTGRRGVAAALFLFGGTLVPALGFVNVYPFVFSYVADHFQYLASLSVFALAAAGATSVAQNPRLRLSPRGARIAGAVVLAALATLTWRQSREYVDPVTLYRATLARNPASWVAHHNLGTELAGRGAAAEALPHARRALELKPDYPEALNNVADDLRLTGSPAEALPLLERAVQLQPKYAQAENNWGIALVALGRIAEGMRHFERAIAVEPRLADAHYNLGLAKMQQQDFAAAIPHFAQAVRLRPDYAAAQFNWAVALAVSNRLPEARPHFARALELDPDSAAMRQTYGRVLMKAGEYGAAVEQLRDALQLDPALAGLHADLAFSLERLGRVEEARQHALQAGR